MKVKIYGFGLMVGNGVTLAEFLTYLQSQSGTTRNDRILGLTLKDGLWAGVVLTIKNARTYCQMQDKGGYFEITAHELDEGTNIVDFDFFIINPTTGRGLYQYYHNSCSVNSFCHLCYDNYKSFKERKISEAVGGNQDKADPKQLRHAKKRFRGWLSYEILVRPEKLETYVANLKRIKSIEFQYATLTASESTFRPLAKVAKRMVHRAVFGNDNTVIDRAKDACVALIKNRGLKRATVVGIDPEDQEATYKLINDHDTYAEYDYDDLTKTVSLDTNDLPASIQSSKIVETLISLSKSDRIKQLLETPAE